MNYRLTKSERLHADKLIKELFNEGSSFFLYPFKVIYLKKNEEPVKINQVLISVSKKKIKKATGRNLIKRRVRESYRLNKNLLPGDGILLAFIFVGNPEIPYMEMNQKMAQILKKLGEELSEKPQHS